VATPPTDVNCAGVTDTEVVEYIKPIIAVVEHPLTFDAGGQVEIAGGVTSAIHVAVLEVVEVLLHPSIAVNVLVCDRLQPLLITPPSIEVTVGDPHASVEVAVPNAAVISVADGLHPKLKGVPVAFNTGAVLSVTETV
jgi:hypothetical protein